MRTVAQELRAKAEMGWDPYRLYARQSRRRLSFDARRVIRDAADNIDGCGIVGINSYWWPQIMSQAIEAAEALGL